MKKNEAAEYLKLNIQMFADTADNDSEEENDSVNTENAGSEEEINFTDGTQNANLTSEEDNATNNEIDSKKISTKAFSERLKREKQKIEQDIEKKKQQDLDKIAITRGFKNWKELEETNQKENLERLGIQDPDSFNVYLDDAISKNPIVVEAQRVLETQKQREQEMILKEAINEISKLDPDIKTVDDLLQLENYDEFYGLVEKGYNLPDAYKIIAFDKIANKKAASAAQNVINNIDSKGHIRTISGTKTKEISVPDDIMASYRKNMPEMTEAQIREHYSRFVGGEK